MSYNQGQQKLLCRKQKWSSNPRRCTRSPVELRTLLLTKNGQRICWSPGHLEKNTCFIEYDVFHWHFVDSLVSRTHNTSIPQAFNPACSVVPPLCFGSSDRSLSLGPLSWRGSYDREDLHLHGGSLPSQASVILRPPQDESTENCQIIQSLGVPKGMVAVYRRNHHNGLLMPIEYTCW